MVEKNANFNGAIQNMQFFLEKDPSEPFFKATKHQLNNNKMVYLSSYCLVCSGLLSVKGDNLCNSWLGKTLFSCALNNVLEIVHNTTSV